MNPKERVYIVGQAVIAPYQSRPDQLITSHRELAEVVFTGDSLAGIIPPNRKFKPDSLALFPELKDGEMITDMFATEGEDAASSMKKIFQSLRPDIGWKVRRTRSAGEDMVAALTFRALESAGITPALFDSSNKWVPLGESGLNPMRISLAVNNTIPNYEIIAQTAKAGLQKENLLDLARGGIPANLYTGTVEGLDSRGPNIVNPAACATAGQNIGIIYDQLRDGRTDIGIAGGFELAPDPTLMYVLSGSGAYVNFDKFKDDPREASRPGDRFPAGMVGGEAGAAFLMMTESGMKRLHIDKSQAIAEVIGISSGQDPDRLVPNKTPREQIRTISEALNQSGILFSDLDVVIPHDTGTGGSAHTEWDGYRQLAGIPLRKTDDHYEPEYDDLPLFSPVKSSTTHFLAASHAVSSTILFEMMNRGIIPRTRNIGPEGPHGAAFNLVYGENRQTSVDLGLVFAKGIAGEVSAVVFRRV